MSEEQDRNRNEWAQLTQDHYLRTAQQQTCIPEGYAPVQDRTPTQGYAPAEAQNGYSDYQQTTARPNDTDQSREVNAYMVDDDDIPVEEVCDFVTRQQKRKSKSQAKLKEEQPKSKRAERREKIASHYGGVSATDSPKGLAAWRDGIFQWWDCEHQLWRDAAYHDEYRDLFIEEDSTEGTYVVAPARGKGMNDVTSACAAFNQLEWRLTDRDSWDNVVDSDGNAVLYLLDRPVDQPYDEPERLWMHDGCVLLDGDNNPVRPWVGIPRCFSSMLEGARLEALRRILPMTIQDFRARMLRAVPTGAGIGAGTKPLHYPSTFGHRSSRFRVKYQCPAWTARAASDVLKREVMDLLPEAEEAKTTEGLQVLSTYEVERRKALTRGKYLYKSNGRAVSEDERKIRDRKFSTKLELKRRREDDNLGPLSKPAAKRGRLGSSPQTPISNQSSGVLESPPQQPEATNTVGNPSTDDIPSEDFQLDYRFVDPQSPLQQLRIQAALFYPRAHYHALTGEYPPHTSAGTYADQYLAISTLLAQNWLMEGDYFPSLAEIGPWSGFDMVPTAPLPDEVMQLILHPAAVTSSVSETSTTYPYDTRGSSAAFGAEDVQTFPNFNSGLESDGDLNVWSDDLFKEYMQDSEDVEGEEE